MTGGDIAAESYDSGVPLPMHGTARLNVSDPDRIELNINSDPANLAATRTTVEQFARTQGGFDEQATSELGLVLNEALANVMRHAYGGATDRPIRIGAAIDRTAATKTGPGRVTLTMTIRDWGTGENPQARLEHIQPNPSKPGGLGLVCLRELTNDVHFEPQPDGMLLTMRKTRRTEGSPQ
jgi:serine/threonine-protein kinase RsbW